MYIQLKGLAVELDDRLKTYVHDHVIEPLQRVYDREGSRLEIELSDDNGPKGGLDKRCRITFEMPFTRGITVTQLGTTPYEAIDLAANRFRHLVRRYKGWKLDRPRRPVKYFVAKVANGELEPDATPEELDPEVDSLGAVERAEALGQGE